MPTMRSTFTLLRLFLSLLCSTAFAFDYNDTYSNQTTLVQCETIECPPINCTLSTRLSGECCEICLDDIPTVPLSPEVPTEDGEEPTNCIYDGIYYRDGDTFHPDSNIFHPGEVNNTFCTTCKCEAGTTVCQNIIDSCPELLCAESDQILNTGECCPTCKPFPPKGAGCQDHNGFVYEEEETFHPYFEVYGGYLDCLNCTCQKNSSITCFKEPCPPVPPCTEEDEIPDIVICCPKCSRGENPPTTPIIQPPSTTPVPLKPCTSDYYYKLYLCPDGKSMVINNVRNNTAQMFVWITGEAKQFIDMTSEDFKANTNCSDSQYYQGSTTEQRVKGLTGKEQKKQKIENCTANCPYVVVKMLRPTDIPIDSC